MGERPSKKQQELFVFINNFITTTGYGPSYREIMRALDYKSVSTVAVHVDGLIAKGLLRKGDNSARSLEVVMSEKKSNNPDRPHIDWLKKQIQLRREQDTKEAAIQVQKLEAALVVLEMKSSEQAT